MDTRDEIIFEKRNVESINFLLSVSGLEGRAWRVSSKEPQNIKMALKIEGVREGEGGGGQEVTPLM